MPLLQVRFTIRRMAIAVAVVAIALSMGIWLTRIGHLSGIYEQRALYHAQQERATRRAIENHLNHIRTVVRYPEKQPMFQHLERLLIKNPRADYHAAMRDKYELASRRPWQPVASDPPPP
jgi:hypothetical protein